MSGLPLSTIILLGAAALSLALETVGTRSGERKEIARPHVAMLVVAAAVMIVVEAIVVAGSPAAAVRPVFITLAIALALVGFAACEGRTLLGDRAAIALALGGVTALVGLGALPSTLEALAMAGCAAVAVASLSVRTDEDAATETAAKQLFVGGAIVIMLGVGLVAPSTGLVTAAVIVGLMMAVGVPPLHGPRLDVAHGAPSGVAALAAMPLVALGPLAADRLLAAPPALVEVVCGIGFVGLPLAALAQVSLRRLFGVLAVMQSLLPIAAAVVGGNTAVAAATGAASVVGLALATWALPALSAPRASWEDISGAGRISPWRAGLVVFIGAFACGLPPTAGFSLRYTLATMAVHGSPHLGLERLAAWLPTLLLLGGAMSALSVVRLALFLFGKTPRTVTIPEARPPAVITVAIVIAIAIGGGLWSSGHRQITSRSHHDDDSGSSAVPKGTRGPDESRPDPRPTDGAGRSL